MTSEISKCLTVAAFHFALSFLFPKPLMLILTVGIKVVLLGSFSNILPLLVFRLVLVVFKARSPFGTRSIIGKVLFGK